MQLACWLCALALMILPLSAQTNIVPALITEDTTWSGTNLLRNTVTVRSNATVRIMPGAKILLDSAATLVVNGNLFAEGTPAEPISFTRAAAGRRWKGIRLINSRDTRFTHSVFEYADSAGTHLDYYDNDCNTNTPAPSRNYHEAIVAIASNVTFESCLFQNLPDSAGSREGDAVAIISDDPQNPGPSSAIFHRCRFISIGQGIHSRFSYILVENSYFTDHHGDNDDIDMYGESVPPPMIRNNIFLNPAHDDAINPTRCSAIIIGNVLSGGDDHGIVLRDRCSPIVLNNFISNFASGGISVQNQCDALIANNTIVNCGRGIRLFDHDTRWGAPYCLNPGSGRATVLNTIIWDCNESLTLTDSPWTGGRGSHVTVAFSNVEGGRASAAVSANSTLVWGEGNRSVDPHFGSNYTLRATSPLIDAGTNKFCSFTIGPALDGNGDGAALPDIGAHEFLLATADSNNDTIPDGWTAQFGFYPGSPDLADSDPDADQHTTLQEWIANTNPTNAASVLRLSLTPNNSALTFPWTSERTYKVHYTTNLLAPVWTEAPQSEPGRVPLTLDLERAFYRVHARLPQ